MFKLHHLRDFSAIAEAGSVRGAARRLNLAQPALTRSLRELELDLASLHRESTARRPVRENLEEFDMPDGRRILVAAEGRLVNLGAAEGHPADVMDMSFSNQALAAEYLVVNKDDLEPRIYTLPPEIDQEVASIKLSHLGGGLETLTEEQVAYLSGWQEGT